ncbi:TonB-dependent receptor [Pararhodonellum marinum]|uniref:TonB-dependent receptor n=1 Tax=Pararhodonellum marinum TaxID=2755358 RepID=UPI00188E883A|nr:carboxypeptidase-like regulatory domain-containing protein [Pararhodonellum marinum]
MKKFFTLIFIALVLFTFSASVDAQELAEDRISGVFLDIPFPRFADQVERNSSFRFYFDTENLQAVRVKLSADQNRIQDVLDIIFENTDWKYTIDAQKRIFISRDQALELNLADDFFEKGSSELDTVRYESDGEELDRFFLRNKLWVIGNSQKSKSASEAVLSGIVTGLESGKPSSGTLIFEKKNYTQAIVDDQGRYSLTLPKGRHTILVQSMGGVQEQRQINLLGDGTLDITLEENIYSLGEVVVSSEKLSNINRPEMGVQAISMQSLRKIPTALGEVDVIKGILTLPGVKTVGEASVGFNVRGGAADQNLILFNNATIYNPSHLFGLFSAFNSDVVEGVELYKGSVPVQYGGRLSSVLDVKPKFGNSEKISGSGGIGLLTSRLMLEGPIGENTTFVVAGRSTYSNWLLNLLEDNTEFTGGGASFYDLNLNVQHKIDDNNTLRLTSYLSSDTFQFDPDTTFSYSNKSVNLAWVHYFNDRLEGEFVAGIDNYQFQIAGRDDPSNAFDFGFNINQQHLRANFSYELDNQHTFNFGMNSIYYGIRPGTFDPFGENSIVIPESVDREQALETALYFGDNFEVNDVFSINYGARYVLYNYLGPGTVNNYAVGQPKSESTLVNQSEFGRGQVINSYHGPEFRVSARYSLDNFSSVKASFNTMRQHIHLLTNTSAITPTDVWKLSDPHVRPQLGNQFSIGYYKNFSVNDLETSVEVYHRSMRNLIDYRSGASLFLNNTIEQDILNTEGRAYGAEFLVRKNNGKLNGWVSYTFSRSLWRTSPDELGEQINDGAYYPSNFDQPHDIMVVANYEFSKRINTSLNANYSTGRPITLPIAKFQYAGSERVYFSDRNQYRIPDYFRIDLAFNMEGNHKVRKLAHASWSFGVYNLLGRSNPYSVYFTPVNGILEGYQLSIFASPIPFITYNFKF